MGRYKDDYSRVGEIVTILCDECQEEVEGRVVVEKYWGADSFLEEAGDMIQEVAVGEPERYLVVEDKDGEEHEGEEV